MPEEDQGTSQGPGQPPPAPPVPLPLTQQQKRRQYFLGLACGLLPVILFLLGYGITLGTQGNSLNNLSALLVLSLLGLFLYIVELIVTIMLLMNKKLRFAGYGLLTAFLATPIVTAIGCTVLPNLIHSS
jgi:hypothetical protein